LPDAQSFSPGGGNAQCQSCYRDALVLEHLHGTIQPSAQTFRPFVQRRYKSLIVDGNGNGYFQMVGKARRGGRIAFSTRLLSIFTRQFLLSRMEPFALMSGKTF
jgi:hypothetical protein